MADTITLPPAAKYVIFYLNFLGLFLFLFSMFSGFTKLSSFGGLAHHVHHDQARVFHGYRQALSLDLFGMDAVSLRVAVAMTEIMAGTFLLTPRPLPAAFALLLVHGVTVYCQMRMKMPWGMVGMHGLVFGFLVAFGVFRKRLMDVVREVEEKEKEKKEE